jgi:hypothetical protein
MEVCEVKYSRHHHSAADVREMVEARTHQFMIDEISETVLVASLICLGKHRSDVDSIVHEAKHKKYNHSLIKADAIRVAQVRRMPE